MKVIIFQGTPEEFNRISETLKSMGNISIVNDPETHIQRVESGLSLEEARHILRRRPLSKKIKRILRVIHGAADSGILHEDLIDKVKMDGVEIGGVLGAFGRRVASSYPAKGYRLYHDFIRYEEEEDGWRYWLTDAARTALESENVVRPIL